MEIQMMEAPNRDYLYLTLCKASSTRGKNEEITLERLPFEKAVKVLKLAERGSIRESADEIRELLEGGKDIFKERCAPVKDRINVFVRYHSMDEWDAVYSKYIARGAELQETEKKVSKKVTEKKDTEYAPLEDSELQEFLDFLRSYQNQVLEQAFTVTVTDVSDERIDAAAEIIKKLVKAAEDYESGKSGMSVAMFNDYRHKLHQKIPRNIPNVRKDDVKYKTQYMDKVKEEISFFTFFKEQVMAAREEQASTIGQDSRIDVLKAHNLEMRKVTEDETEHIKQMLGKNAAQFSRAWRVENLLTRKYFENYLKEKRKSRSAITELWHGSGTENWWSIMSNGMWLHPEALGVRICGKMFGNGIYFAPLAQKSIGYTSLSGSCWKGGQDNKAYLAIFEVITGEVYDVYKERQGTPDNYSELQKMHPGADCLWAMSRGQNQNSPLRNEEVIVYTDGSTKVDSKIPEDKKLGQCTIKYIVEVERTGSW